MVARFSTQRARPPLRNVAVSRSRANRSGLTMTICSGSKEFMNSFLGPTIGRLPIGIVSPKLAVGTAEVRRRLHRHFPGFFPVNDIAGFAAWARTQHNRFTRRQT